MNSVISKDAKLEAARAWKLVFRSTDPFGWPFTSSLQFGRVIFPTDGCQLFRAQFEGLAQIARMHGETHCYLAVAEGHESIEGNDNEQILLVDLSDYESYSKLHLTLENALYSTRGAWGLLISHEMHGVLGGDEAFISEADEVQISTESDWLSFLSQWRDERHKEWVSELGSHVEN